MRRSKEVDKGIMIGENYKVTTDTLNITLWKRTVIKGVSRNPNKVVQGNIGKERFDALFYFNDFKELLKALAKYEINGVGLGDLEKRAKKEEEIIQLIEKLPDELLPQLKEK